MNRESIELSNIDQLFDFENGNIIKNELLASGKRIRRSFAELFSGYNLRGEDVLNETCRVDAYSGTVHVGSIGFYTYCAHHFAPFFGKADVIYHPNEIITGLGKIVRLVKDVHARRLQIQETMTKDIADDIMACLSAKGVRVITRAKHLCICSRGPSDDNSWTEVVYAKGTLNKECKYIRSGEISK